MRQFLLFSLLAAVAAVGLLAYQLMPRGGRAPEPARPTVAAAPEPVRTIPTRPREATAAAPAADSPAPDVLRDASRTLGELRTRDESEGGKGLALTPTQVDALKAQAERRHIRPVTRMTFPLEPGTTVPPQVYLHPMPPELAGLSSAADPLGFIQIGDKFVLVWTVSRRIVAVVQS